MMVVKLPDRAICTNVYSVLVRTNALPEYTQPTGLLHGPATAITLL